jgi:hypothetical protein
MKRKSWIKNIKTMAMVAIATMVTVSATAEFVTPTAVTVSSAYKDSPGIKMIDGSGLSEESPAATHDNGNSSIWFIDNVTVDGSYAIFDLGETRDVFQAYVWNENQATANLYLSRGVATMNIHISPDSDPLTATWTDLGLVTLAVAGGTAAEPAQIVPIAGDGTRLIKFELKTSQGGNVTEYCGLSEVRFEAVGNVELLLSPSEGLDIDLVAPATLSTGVVEAAFIYGLNNSNVEITAVDVIDQQHPGAFDVVDFSSPMELTSPAPATEPLYIEFNLAGTGLGHNETSTGVVEVIWNEIGGSSSFTNTVPVTATYILYPGATSHKLEYLGSNDYETYNGMAIDFNAKTNGVLVEYDLPLVAGDLYSVDAISVIKHGTGQAGTYYMAVYDSVVDTVPAEWGVGELTFSGFRGVSINAADANVADGTDVTWTFSNVGVVADSVPMTSTAIDTTGGSGKLFFVLQDTPDDRTGIVATTNTMYVKRGDHDVSGYCAAVMESATGWRDTRVPVYKAALTRIPRETPVLQIASADGTLDFAWNSSWLQAYTLEATPSLVITNWAVYNDGVTTYEDIPASGTGTNTLTEVLANGAENFFRVISE